MPTRRTFLRRLPAAAAATFILINDPAAAVRLFSQTSRPARR